MASFQTGLPTYLHNKRKRQVLALVGTYVFILPPLLYFHLHMIFEKMGADASREIKSS